MADTTGEVLAALGPSVLVGLDGQAYPAARKPSLKDALPYIAAVEGRESVQAQLAAARALLVGMGFPEAVVDDLDVDAVIERATGFFSAAFQRGAGAGS